MQLGPIASRFSVLMLYPETWAAQCIIDASVSIALTYVTLALRKNA